MDLRQARNVHRPAANVTVGALTAVTALLAATPAMASAATADSGFDDIAVTTPSTGYRIPSITVTTHGTTILTYDRRNGSDQDLPNDIDVMQRRSTDNGKTWSEPETIVNPQGPAGCGDSSTTVDRKTGRIFLFCTYSAGDVGFTNSQPGTNDSADTNTLHVQVRQSDDDGRSWSAPADLNPQVKNTAWRGYFSASGHGIQTSAGRLIQPVVVKDGSGTNHSANLYSDDHGATWHAGELLAAGTDESKAVELADGTVVQNSRPAVDGNRRLLSTSTDAGRSFSAAKPDAELPDPKVNGDEIRVDPSSDGPHRNWLLFANAANETEREDLTLRLSCDNGATWPVRKTLHSGPSAYVATAMLPNGRVGVFAETGTGSPSDKLTFTTVGISDLSSCSG